MHAQDCPVSFAILAGNNSKDNTLAIPEKLAREPGVNLRYVTENQQGIVRARNQGLKEVLDNDILVFMDDHELPQKGLLNTAYDAIVNKRAQCAGERVELAFHYRWPLDLAEQCPALAGRHRKCAVHLSQGAARWVRRIFSQITHAAEPAAVKHPSHHPRGQKKLNF